MTTCRGCNSLRRLLLPLRGMLQREYLDIPHWTTSCNYRGDNYHCRRNYHSWSIKSARQLPSTGKVINSHQHLLNTKLNNSPCSNTVNVGRNKMASTTSAPYDAEQFGDMFDTLVDDVIAVDAVNPEISAAALRFKEVLCYNVPDGKRNRGLSVVSSFRYMADESQLTDSNVKKAMVLGWCVELLQAYFLISDDIMDQSKTRRGKPCWYIKVKGYDAINDSFFVEASIYKILKKYIRKEPYYLDAVELFHESNYQTIVGQCLDLMTESDGNLAALYTQERYDAIVKWKTAFYSFYLPVALAMYMVGNNNDNDHQNAKRILLKMGHFFQVQDDFLDCFGDPEVIGKIGTDIEENKCCWLVVQALKLVDAEQRKLLEDNYGVDDPSKVVIIKRLYKDLDIEGVFHKYEEESYQDLIKLIDECSGNLPKDMFVAYANKIYKRKK